jgi:hypothetical protein
VISCSDAPPAIAPSPSTVDNLPLAKSDVIPFVDAIPIPTNIPMAKADIVNDEVKKYLAERYDKYHSVLDEDVVQII